jgi:hypothetical protein
MGIGRGGGSVVANSITGMPECEFQRTRVAEYCVFSVRRLW